MGRIRLALLASLALVLLAIVPSANAQSPEPRVVGGSETTIEEYPWQAAIVFDSAKEPGDAHERQFCGGSLLTTQIVLTAAHCVADTDPDCEPPNHSSGLCAIADDTGDGTVKLDPDDVDVVLGVTTLSTATPADERAIHADVVDADAISHHPGYVPYTNDVGYLVLADPVTTGSTIETIDIAGDDEAAVWAPDVFVDISGWGNTEYGGDAVDTLRAGSVPIVSDPTCASLDGYNDEFDPATMVCAGYLSGGVDTCQGDSGGPLEAPLDNGEYRLVGITSWGFGCAEPDAPGVYTRIAQAAPGGLRDDVVAKVDELELAFGLTDEPIVGTGGLPQGGGPRFPPPSSGGGTAAQTVTTSPTSVFTDPFLKCQKLKYKKKRKRCNKKVRLALGL